ncbi:monovalent cation/H(+) antiporter subunit G [Nannocystis pusilla]|uniref:Monovalent cation/H(+) antiporter subunit G n=1 Tax=Nannocystis pusilla TaxID=889268 RepID=A0ABS7U5U5_9BACT|nr:monovalent cation/H(+) antiporter subunit G [Nannocystis pusilla]MBZ5715675.1 monovalent cation/H(+) antiporter subunit G [Nannocystis pusilla]
MTVPELLEVALIATGSLFFVAGTVGMLRFPDVFMRLHALTKADNLGMGLVIAGLLLRAPSWHRAVKLLLIWGLVLLASTVACHLVAQSALRAGLSPWRRP